MIPAVVMAAGLGTRLRPLTERYAKAVLPIDGRPVVARLLRELAAAGCPRVTVVVGHLGEQVQRLLGDGGAFGVPVRYARQPQADGSADAGDPGDHVAAGDVDVVLEADRHRHGRERLGDLLVEEVDAGDLRRHA